MSHKARKTNHVHTMQLINRVIYLFGQLQEMHETTQTIHHKVLNAPPSDKYTV